jgi:hypothetical protein
LGKVVSGLPKKHGGLHDGIHGTSPNPSSKENVLKGAGMSVERGKHAERLSRVSPERINAAIDAGAKSVTALQIDLGVRSKPSVMVSEKVLRNFDAWMDEAIAMLERSVAESWPPHEGNVRELRDRLNRLRSARSAS